MADNFYANYPVEGGGSGGGVTSLNSLTGALTLVAGSGITITPAGSNITIAATGGGGSGTVTSVAMSVPSFLSISGSPITTSGTLALSLSGTALPVSSGGTGVTSLTLHDLIVGNGTSSVTFIAPGSSGNILTSNGTNWSSQAQSTFGFANKTLSNLTAPTSVSASLLPATSSIVLGARTAPWTILFMNGMIIDSNDVQAATITPTGRLLQDLVGTPSVDFDGRKLIDSTGGVTSAFWSSTGISTAHSLSLLDPISMNPFSMSAASGTAIYSVVWPPAVASVSGQALTSDTSGNLSWTTIGGGGSGTVTSVALADTSTTPIYTVSGSPITTSGTIDLTLNTQSANVVFAGPATGSAAQPTFRALVAADLPGGGFANTALSNLASTAVNVDIMPAASTTINLGNAAGFNFQELFVGTISSDNTLTLQTEAAGGPIHIQPGTNGAGTGKAITLLGGSGTPNGGIVSVTGGTGTTNGGQLNLAGGAGTTNGGSVNITAGTGGSLSGSFFVSVAGSTIIDLSPTSLILFDYSSVSSIQLDTRQLFFSSGAVALDYSTAGHVSVANEIRILGSSSGFSALKAPATGSSNEWTMPGADGTSGQVLSTNGSHTLSFTSTLPYTAGNPADWAGSPPTTVGAALDRIAAVVGGVTPIP